MMSDKDVANTQSMSRRQFLKVASLTAAGGVLAACAPPAIPSASDSDMGDASPEAVTLRYGRHDPGGGVEITLESFAEEFPNINVEIEVIGEFHAKVPAMAAAGNLPDVVRSWEGMALELGRNNQFIDVQPMVDGQADFNPEDFYENWWTYQVVDGKRFGIPDAAATHMTFYNVDLFEASGVELIDPDNFTWAAFEEKARGISDPDNQIWGSETIPVGWHNFSVKQVWQNSGRYYSPDFKECWIGQPESVEALQFWADMLLDGNVMPSPSQIIGIGGSGAAAELFGAGKLGMQRMGTWITGGLVEAGFRFNIAPEPHSTVQDTISHGAFNNIAATSEHKDEAWTWLSYNTSTQGIYNYASQAKFPGVRRSSNEIDPKPWVADVDFDVDWDLIPASLEYAHILPGPANEGEALKIIGDALEKVYSGDAKAADILPEIEPQVTEVISEV